MEESEDADVAPPPLRFAAGDAVRCRVSQTGWARGHIVALQYREKDWPAGWHAPYQIELEDGGLIFAPADDDQLIRSEADFERLMRMVGAGGADPFAAAHTVGARDREEVLRRYPRKHPRLFDPAALPSFLAPPFAEARGDDAALRALWTEEARGLYSLRLFTDAFCDQLLEEAEHFEAWALASGVEVHRPNTMNRHGAIVDDFGLEPMMDAIMRECVQPLARVAGYADVLGGEALLRSHHAFVVSYALGKDIDLKFHVDSSDVTLNVCLGRTPFEGGALFFRGVRCPKHQQGPSRSEENVEYVHTPGTAIMHRGHHRHGARAITAGERHNLILWCRGDPERSSEACRSVHECEDWCWARSGLLTR